MQPQSSQQYDFIMNPDKPPKQSVLTGLPGNKNPMIIRLVVIAGLVLAAIVFFVFIASLLGGSSNTPKLTTVAQQQNELIRIATLATTQGTAQSSEHTKNFSESCLLSLTSAQQQLVKFLGSGGKKLGPKELSLTKNSASDAAITSAIAASNFDSTFASIMHNDLKSYEAAIKDALSNTTNTAEQKLLSDDYSGEQLLLQQLGNSG